VSTYEAINYWASAYASVACIVFVIAYSTLAPWWKTATGRLIMMLIGSLAGLAVLTLAFYHYHDANVVRLIRSALVLVVGTALWAQVVAVVRVQRKSRRSRK
jgi:hypothetical protein